jgi:hypothetical protein|tara:strand:+ start:315 stop:431 length:117 start_codon:yes stop_codon:yes gene_type:complete
MATADNDIKLTTRETLAIVKRSLLLVLPFRAQIALNSF